MQFLYPTFLFALATILIPILIHLFHFRRFKKVYFTNVKFLKEVKEETSNRNRLKHLLILLSRILAVAGLVFAFAQPFIPQGDEVKTGEKAVSVFVDNSYSMSSLSADVPLLEKAKQRAREIVAAYSVEDRFQVLTHDFEGRHQRMVNKENALALIDEIEITPAVRNLSKVVSRVKQALGNSTIENKSSYIISDFQKNITDLGTEQDTTIDFNLVPLQSVRKQNISLDSAWFAAPVQMLNQNNKLLVKVRNLSDEKAENVRLTLNHGGQTKPMGTLTIPAQSEIIDTVNITVLKAGWHEAELSITDYPVQFDDKLFFTFNVPEEINILVIDEGNPNRYLKALFAGVSIFKVDHQRSNGLDYSKLPTYNLIVLDELSAVSSGLGFELKNYVANGGNLVVFPHSRADINSYKSFLGSFPANELMSFDEKKREVGRMNTEEFIFKDVYENTRSNLRLPNTEGNFQLTKFGSRGEEQLLTYRDGTTFLGKYRVDQGHLYLCASPLDDNYSDLVRNAEVFVPMIYKMALSSAKSKKIAQFIGKDEILEASNSLTGAETVYKMKGSAEEFIPEQRKIGSKVIIGINNQIKEAGFYNLFYTEDDLTEKFAYNYDRRESELDYLSDLELKEKVGASYKVLASNAETDFTQYIGERSRGIVLWKWCLIAALIFLAIETLLLRFWRT
ncbi:MAG: hypothetical protein ACI94Y_000962 [Maribacter sp.]|jgi:hypothetical protein